MLNINKASRTICNGICRKSQQLQIVEIRKMVSVDPAWNILTCASQNIWMKKCRSWMLRKSFTNIIYTNTANEEAVLKSILLSLSITARRFFSFWIILGWKLEIVAGFSLVRVSCAFVHKKFQWTRSGQAPSRVEFSSFICHTVTLQLVTKSVQISSHLLICVCTSLVLYKIVLWPPEFRRCLIESLH